MNSPFEIFRKHQKAAMVILVFMAMFAFVVLDSIQRFSGNLSTPIIALALGTLLAGVFWFVGNQKQQGKEYAVLGLVIGVAAGVIGPQLNRPAAAFYSSVGNLSDRDFREAMARRHMVNNFFRRAEAKIIERYRKQHPNAQPHELPRMAGGYKFALFYNPDAQSLSERDVTRDIGYSHVFRHEADKMGITVSDEAITDYIGRATREQLSAADFKAALRESGLSETYLYDAIREELKARLAFDCLRPRAFPVPDDYWQLYRRMNVRQELDVVAVPVAEFVAGVPEPSEGELAAFFKQHADRPASREVTAEPAFGQPRKVQIAYLKAGVEQFEGAVSKELDKEIAEAEAAGKPTPIEAHYEANKDNYRNFPAEDKTKKGPKLSAPDLPDESKSKDGKTPEDGKKPEGTEPDGDKKPDDKKPEGDKKPDEGKPEEKKPATPEEKKPTEEKKPEDKSGGDGDEEEDESKDGNDAKDAPKKAAADAKPDSKPESKPDAKPETKPADGESPKTEGDDKKAGSDKPAAVEDPLPEFKPLDDKLKEEIRRQVINERVARRLDEKIEKALAAMSERADKIREQQFEAAAKAARKKSKGEDVVDHKAVSKDLQEWADENGFRYGVTGLVSLEDLTNPDENPVGAAAEALGDPRGARTVAMSAYQADPKQTYLPATAVDRFTGSRYCWWKVIDRPPYVPTLADEGMKEKAVAAWKLAQAREPAENRAKAVAELVRAAGDKPLSEALAGQTVTGKEAGVVLAVRETEPFSWIRRGAAPSGNPFASPPPELSTISSVDKADEAFMEQIFLKMKEGDVEVVANADKSVYYVVRVKNRIPSTEEGEKALREQFLAARSEFFPDANQFLRMFRRSPYVQMMEQEQYALFQKWQLDLQKKYLMEFPDRTRGARDAEE